MVCFWPLSDCHASTIVRAILRGPQYASVLLADENDTTILIAV
jgi:hypothetical protein